MKYIKSLNEVPLNSNVAIYGAGQMGRALEETIIRDHSGLNFISFIDDYEAINKKIIRAPQIHTIDVDVVLIPARTAKVMSHTLSDLGFTNFLILHPKMDYAHSFFRHEKEYDFWAKKFSQVCSLLSTKDAEVYQNLIDLRTADEDLSENHDDRDFSLYPNRENHYFDYINKKAIRNIIEGGVWTGDTSCQFLDKLPNIKKIYGFDPCYSFLQRGPTCDRLKEDTRFAVIKKGLWSHKTQLCLDLNGSATKVMDSSNSSNKVDVTSIDEFSKEQGLSSVDFIKLDVEGAELPVLKGAIHTLIKDRPQLAISIYHSRTDMVDIPLFMAKTLKNYNFYLGHYGLKFLETVFYAVPKELDEN